MAFLIRKMISLIRNEVFLIRNVTTLIRKMTCPKLVGNYMKNGNLKKKGCHLAAFLFY